MDAAPQIEAQHAGQAAQQQDHAVERGGLATRPAEVVHAAADQVLKDRDHRGQAGEGHEQEEQRAPDPPAAHVQEHPRQGDEDQARPRVRLHVVAEAGREDDEAAAQGHEGVQHDDPAGFADKGPLLRHIAAEDLHRRAAQAQGEEGLVHRRGDDAAEALLRGAAEVRQQVEGQALPRPGQRDRVDRQHDDQAQQPRHHHLRDALHALLQLEGADRDADHHGDCHVKPQLPRAAQQRVEHPADGLCRHALKGPGQKLDEIAQHPAGHGGVVHHQQIVRADGHPAVEVPFAAARFQRPVAAHRALPRGPPHRQLHRQHRRAHNDQKQQIEQHEDPAAVLPGDKWEFPDVPDPDRAARAHQQKAEPRLEALPFHIVRLHVLPDRSTELVTGLSYRFSAILSIICR